MDLSGAFFYLFSAIMLASAFMVVAARNPVHAVLFLILAFVNAAGLFLLLSAVFVVMMLDVDFAELKQGFLQYLPIGALIGVVFLIELILVGATVVAGGNFTGAPLAVNAVAASAAQISNVKAIGQVLYTSYVYYFEAAG